MAKTPLFNVIYRVSFTQRYSIFWKTGKYQRFLRSSRPKNRFKRCKTCCNLQRVDQRFGIQKLPKHRYLQCFVPSTFSWNCKNRVNTSMLWKCCNWQCVFCFAFKNTGICSVLCISGLKSMGIYNMFCVFAWLPQKTLTCKNVVIYSILLISKSWKSSEKCVMQNGIFSDFRYPQNGGGLCSWRRLWATLPQQSEGFSVFFFGARRRSHQRGAGGAEFR